MLIDHADQLSHKINKKPNGRTKYNEESSNEIYNEYTATSVQS